mgnify:CR=1 FL=1
MKPALRKPAVIAAFTVAFGVAAVTFRAMAGPERVEFPVGYQQKFVVFGATDRPDRKPAQVRVFYANPEAAAAARADQPVPDGAVLIMEDRKAKLGAAGNPEKDATGRFIASDDVLAVFVQEKRRGWGEAYPANVRNGDWDYAVFQPGGARRDVSTAGCFSCHLKRAPTDYTFIFQRWAIDGKPTN